MLHVTIIIIVDSGPSPSHLTTKRSGQGDVAPPNPSHRLPAICQPCCFYFPGPPKLTRGFALLAYEVLRRCITDQARTPPASFRHRSDLPSSCLKAHNLLQLFTISPSTQYSPLPHFRTHTHIPRKRQTFGTRVRSSPTQTQTSFTMSAELDNLIYSMNDTANDGQDLALNLRELIADLPASSSLAQDLASNLSLFGRVLRELALYLGTPKAPYSATCIEVIEVTSDHVESLYDQVDDMLYRYEKDPHKDFRHTFKDSKVLALSAKLESSRLTLNVMLAILQLRALTNLQECEFLYTCRVHTADGW